MKSTDVNKKNTPITDKIKIFFRMVSKSISGIYSPNKWNLIIGILSVFYVISPLDFIPEIALGPIGLLDDAAILAFAYSKINKEINNFILWEIKGDSNNTIIDIE